MAYGPDWTGMRDHAPIHRLSLEQDVTNAEWPDRKIARLTPVRRPVPVNARLVFDNDGEVWLPGHAVRWIRPVVFVQVDDSRIRGFGVWLPASDIRHAPE